MNENINIAKILKDAPKGTKLWSPLCGECSLYGVDMSSDVPISVEVKVDKNNHDCMLSFAANGKYFNRLTSAECLLFPSRENRDWSTFKVPQKHKYFEPCQKVLIPYYDGYKYRWKVTIYSHYEEGREVYVTVNGVYMSYEKIIPYEGNEDKLGKPVE